MEEIDKRFIKFYQEMGSMTGADSLATTIFAMLYIEPDEISMEELSKRTGYSLASICNKIKALESAGLITIRKKPGTKRIFLYAEKNMIKMLEEIMIRKQEHDIKFVKEKIPGIIAEFKNKTKTDSVKKKIKILENYYHQMLRCDQIITELLKKLNAKENEKDRMRSNNKT